MLRILIQLRNDAGLDQTTLAHRLDITQSEVSKYERGERNLDVLRLREWLHALEVELPTFINALDRQLKEQESTFVSGAKARGDDCEHPADRQPKAAAGSYGCTQVKEAAALTSPPPL